MEQGVNEVIVNELTIQFKNLGLIDECINDVKNALVDISKVCKGEQENIDEAYQRGLTDAWECMKKIAFSEKPRDMRDFFGHTTFGGILTGYTATEAIEKLKAYEEKQKADDEIKVGDEVVNIQSGTRFCVTHLWVNNHGEKGVSGFNHECSAFQDTNNKVKKTGRHFDIDKILEAMKE